MSRCGAPSRRRPSRLGCALTPADVQGPAEIERAIEALAREPNGGLIVLSGPITNTHRELIAALAVRHRLPTAYGFRYFVTSGGLMSYGIDRVEQSRQAAGYVDRILKGERTYRYSNRPNSSL